MPSVHARPHENFEVTIRRFKKAVEKSDLMKELRNREFYEKPCTKRKRAKAAAVKRAQREENEREAQRRNRWADPDQ